MKSITYAIEIIPELTDFGIEQHFKGYPERAEVKVERERKQKLLLENVSEFEETCKWLDQVEKTKQINRKVGTSYSLKHVAEKDVCNGYVSNGCFIAAAVCCGFDFTISGPNAYFNMSLGSINKILKRQSEEGKR